MRAEILIEKLYAPRLIKARGVFSAHYVING